MAAVVSGRWTRTLVAVGVAAVGMTAAGCGTGTPGQATAGVSGTSLATSASATTTSGSAEPFDGEVLKRGEVAELEDTSGARLNPVSDGDLRNFGISAKVFEIGTTDEITSGRGYRPDTGNKLLVFSVKVERHEKSSAVSGRVSASVSVEGRQQNLPGFDELLSYGEQDGTLHYAVGVPAQDPHDVELQLKYSDLAQRFDLLDGRRTGDQPAVLYRSDDYPTVWVERLTPSSFEFTRPGDDEGPTRFTIPVERAELTYFAPVTGNAPEARDKAWLVLRYKAVGEGPNSGYASQCAVPLPAYTLTDDKGGTYQPVDRHSRFDSDGAVVTFEVPADLATATLRVAPTTLNCDTGGTSEPWPASGAAEIPFTLPAS
ncbi:hypothetical protein [Goodfellowiella coeruleoviolacea]|uniref:hypothetical protein n=1 Tax=Goodfellowiella coeruleoviolacea TaxID=334858 RepID=UPI0020A3280C|nr:hypothetical protein [Goodfellowiella coeruleoviolacea]